MIVRSDSVCLNSFTPRDKETAGDWDRCRIVHGGGRGLRRTGRRGGQLGASAVQMTSCSSQTPLAWPLSAK